MNLPIADYTIIYNTKDISRDISAMVMTVEYQDKVQAHSDTMTITVMDKDLRWQNGWYPVKGDTIQVFFRMSSQQLNCGTFEVDELEVNSSAQGDIFSIKALAAGIKKQLRTKSSYAHENKTLAQIAATVATTLGLTVQGTIPDITLARANQYRETPLQFLNRVGSEYGCLFSVRDSLLVFTYFNDLEGRPAAFVLTKQQLLSWSLRDTTHATFKKSRVRHHDPLNKETVDYIEDYDDSDGQEDSTDDLDIHSRVENKSQAESKAKYALFKHNTKGVGGDIALAGNLLFMAGNNFQLQGAGQMSGIYHILESTHNISASGAYQTSGNIKRVGTIDPKYFKTT